jgi:hypothetical protein
MPLAHAFEIGRREAQGRPLREGEMRRSDLDAVLIVGCAIGFAPHSGRPKGVDLGSRDAEALFGRHARLAVESSR